MLTPIQAYLIAESHELLTLLDNQEELELLESNNPELLDAYRALLALAGEVE